MNVALVVLDTLRLDAFREQFEWLPGHRFTQAWAPGNWTVPVHAAMFTGRSPAELGVHDKHQTLDCPDPTLAEMLGEIGYQTRAFSSNPNVSPVFQFDRGFDEFRGSWRLQGMKPGVFDWEGFIAANRLRGPFRYLSALSEVLFGDVETVPSLRRGLDIKLRDLGVRSTPSDDGAQEALSFVESTDFGDKEFLFMNLMEAHAPYDPPREYWTVDVGTDDRSWTTYPALLATITGGPPDPATGEHLRQAYWDSVRYLSDIYEDIFTSLYESFDVVITLGDHGELFGEYDTWQHAYGIYPELTHVPLVISGDEIDNGMTDTPVSLTDVFHTITKFAGVENEDTDRSLMATDGSPCVQERLVYTEYHGVDDRNWQQVEGKGYDPSPYDERLFGVADENGQYGYQAMNEFIAPAECRDTLETYVEEYISSLDVQSLGVEDDVPESVQRQLEDLGYM